jgi:hypothetical protein
MVDPAVGCVEKGLERRTWKGALDALANWEGVNVVRRGARGDARVREDVSREMGNEAAVLPGLVAAAVLLYPCGGKVFEWE